MDACFGAVLAAIATPVIVLLAGMVACRLRTWPFFVQDRLDADGRRFRFVKLRTLPPGTHRYALKPALAGLRLPGSLRLMRRLHLDELPQLFLVPLGRMSLVGPRPKMPDEHEPADHGYLERRMQVPQGCTGLWQIGADRDLLPNEAPNYDLFYVDHASLRLDVWILWRTLLRVLGVGRLVTLDQVPSWARRHPARVGGGVRRAGTPVRELLPGPNRRAAA